jgi:4-diphosphocytidyl-2-C-methyl-D-erythritol kinase
MVKRLQISTPAKINLFIRITGRRPDGYHELDSVFLPVSLFDRVSVEAAEAAHAEILLRCNWAHLPLDDRNLAARAARYFLEHHGPRWRVSIDLQKEIPDGAGLGGGSSDAGAVLRMLARMHGIEPASLAPLALRLGADIPFFLDPRAARVGGIGERITNIQVDYALDMVIGVPPVTVPTAEVYRSLEPRDWSGPGPALLPARADGLVPDLLVNDLERPAIARYPQIAEVKQLLRDLGANGVLMSGSGGAVFALFQGPKEASAAMQAAAAQMPQARFFAVAVVRNRPD